MYGMLGGKNDLASQSELEGQIAGDVANRCEGNFVGPHAVQSGPLGGRVCCSLLSAYGQYAVYYVHSRSDNSMTRHGIY
jgi:hypothetical protein